MSLIVTPRVRIQETCMNLRAVPDNSNMTVQVQKEKIESVVAMLHQKEHFVLLHNENVRLTIENQNQNCFCVYCDVWNLKKLEPAWQASIEPHLIEITNHNPSSKMHSSIQKFCVFVQQQLLPNYMTALCLSTQLQNLQCFPLQDLPELKRINPTFVQNNKGVISKVTDLLNSNFENHNQAYSFQYAARLIWLASGFCATAPVSKIFNLFHVSQMQVDKMSEQMVERVYEADPEKQHVTTLLRGNDKNDRIMRFNLAVRIFTQDSELTRELISTSGGLNKTFLSPVIIMTGICNNQAAAVYVSSDSLHSSMHKRAVSAYYNDTES